MEVDIRIGNYLSLVVLDIEVVVLVEDNCKLDQGLFDLEGPQETHSH